MDSFDASTTASAATSSSSLVSTGDGIETWHAKNLENKIDTDEDSDSDSSIEDSSKCTSSDSDDDIDTYDERENIQTQLLANAITRPAPDEDSDGGSSQEMNDDEFEAEHGYRRDCGPEFCYHQQGGGDLFCGECKVLLHGYFLPRCDYYANRPNLYWHSEEELKKMGLYITDNHPNTIFYCDCCSDKALLHALEEDVFEDYGLDNNNLYMHLSSHGYRICKYCPEWKLFPHPALCNKCSGENSNYKTNPLVRFASQGPDVQFTCLECYTVDEKRKTP